MDADELESKLRELLREIRELYLTRERIEYKRLFSKGQQLRLQLIHLGRMSVVAEFDELTTPVSLSDNVSQRSSNASGRDSERSSGTPAVTNSSSVHDSHVGLGSKEEAAKGFTLPASFLSYNSDANSIEVKESNSDLTLDSESIRTPSKVFIQYAHVDEPYRKLALELAGRLRSDGVVAMIDFYDPNPKEGWITWMEKQLREANYVLILCSEQNRKTFYKEQPPPSGMGATWEGDIIKQYLYNAGVVNEKFIPVLLREEDRSFVPEILQQFTSYHVYNPSGYDRLVRFLTRQPEVEVPPVNPVIRKIPPNHS